MWRRAVQSRRFWRVRDNILYGDRRRIRLVMVRYCAEHDGCRRSFLPTWTCQGYPGPAGTATTISLIPRSALRRRRSPWGARVVGRALGRGGRSALRRGPGGGAVAPPEAMTSGQITYDLRRLRIHGLICASSTASATGSPSPDSARPSGTPRLTQRFLIRGLAELTDPSPPAPARLRAAARAYEASLDDLARKAGLAALPCPCYQQERPAIAKFDSPRTGLLNQAL
jgi:hypothetical protein